MFGLPLAFAAPAVLAALVGLVGLYFLLRVTPPSAPSGDIPAAAASPRARSERNDAGAHALADPGAPARDRGAHHSRHGRAVVEQPGRALRIGAASDSDRRRICRGSGLGQANRFRPGARGGGGAVRSNRGDRSPLAGRAGHRAARQIRGRGPVARRWRRFPTRRTARRRCRRSSAFSPASRRPTSCGSPTGSNSAARAPFPPGSRRSPTRSRS